MKANDVVVLNLAGVTDMTDYFVIASGTSDTHVRSIGEHVIAEMKNRTERHPRKGYSRAAGCCSISSIS
jgi:ribosomal silencing factor RsfS